MMMRTKPCKRDHPLGRSYHNGREWVCRDCVRIHSERYRTTCSDIRIKHRDAQRRARAKVRQEVHAAYGGKCACCGESDPRKLTVDHVNGDGASFRKKPGYQAFYFKIRREGFPSIYQLLCWSCNAVKHFYPGEECCSR